MCYGNSASYLTFSFLLGDGYQSPALPLPPYIDWPPAKHYVVWVTWVMYQPYKCSVGSLSCPPFMGQIILKCKTLLVPLPLVTLMVLLYPSFLLSVLHTFSCLPAFTHVVCCTWNILLPIIPNDLAIFHLSFVPHLKLYFLVEAISTAPS